MAGPFFGGRLNYQVINFPKHFSGSDYVTKTEDEEYKNSRQAAA
jgi:hypothetical protein